MNYEDYSKIVTDAIKAVKKKIITAAIVSKFPFMAVGIQNKIMNHLVSKYVDWIVDHAEMRVFYAYVDLRVNSQTRDFLKVAIEYHGANTDERKNIEPRLIDSFRTLAKLR